MVVRHEPNCRVGREQNVVKDKKKKTKGKQGGSTVRKAAKGIKAAAQNPLVADVVAAALVATAAALKNPKKARQLAEQAGDEITALSKKGAEQGNAMWQLALDVGRRAMESLAGDGKGKAAKPAKKPAKKSPKKATIKAKKPAGKSKAN
jgi:hypothetical protein